MNYGAAIFAAFLLCAVLATLVAAGKNKKSHPPQWKTSSMPYKNRRFIGGTSGDEMKMDCKTLGNPKPNIKWTKNGQPIRKNTSPKMVLRKFGLSLENTSTDMAGNYSCVVKNKHGSLDWTFIVDITEPIWPLVVSGPKNVTQMMGNNIAFQCHVLNDPNAFIRWKRVFRTKDKKGKERVRVVDLDPEEDVLLIEDIKKEDEGEYLCLSGNLNGFKKSTAWLKVIEPVVATNPPSFSGNRGQDGEWPKGNIGDDDDDDGFGGMYDRGNPPSVLDFGPDPFFTTTKRPRSKNNGRRKNGRRKNKKNKSKNTKQRIPTTPLPTVPSSSLTDSTLSSSSLDIFGEPRTTRPSIWDFNNNGDDDIESFTDSRSNSGGNDGYDVNGEGNVGSSQADENESKLDISAWKIYTIVGAVGGVVLLVGLVAITIAMCCPKQENGVYKSTPV